MKRRWSRIFALLLGTSLLLGMLAACGSGSGSNPTSSGPIVIKVGTDFPTTGKDQSGGLTAEEGAHLAVDQAIASNYLGSGYQLVFANKNDVSTTTGSHNADVGAANVKALIDDAQVAGMVGPLNSGVAVAEMPIANRAGFAMISPANTLPCLTKTSVISGCSGSNNIIASLRPTGNVTYFRIATTDDHQGAVGADVLYNTVHARKVYVVDDAEVYGIGIANAFVQAWMQLGGTVIAHDSIPASTTNYVPLLTKIASTHPDAIYFGGTDATGGTPFRQQMKDVPGLATTPFGTGDGLVTGDFATQIAPLLGGAKLYGTTGSVDFTKNPSAQDFINAYTAKYGPLGAYSASAYDCAKILLAAIKSAIDSGAKPPTNAGDSNTAKTFRQAVISAIMKTDYMGVTGHHTFDANGDTTDRVVSIFQLMNSKNPCDSSCWVFVKSVTITS